MGDTDRTAPDGVNADPAFRTAVMSAMHGDPSRLAALGDERLQFAARSISILIAGRLTATHPCELAGFTFHVDSGVMTFTAAPGARIDQDDLTAARMVAVDASAFLAGDHGPATHSMWLDLWDAVPATSRRHLALVIGKKFTAVPARSDHTPGDPHGAF